MIEDQKMTTVPAAELPARVKEFYDSGYRLVQISCTRTKGLEVNYSFDRDYGFVNLRVVLPAEGAELPSISGIFWSAFLYENEMHDLFGIKVEGMAVDFQGKFFRTSVRSPFNPENIIKEGNKNG
jgi:ech hydrogenase subunit D